MPVKMDYLLKIHYFGFNVIFNIIGTAPHISLRSKFLLRIPRNKNLLSNICDKSRIKISEFSLFRYFQWCLYFFNRLDDVGSTFLLHGFIQTSVPKLLVF